MRGRNLPVLMLLFQVVRPLVVYGPSRAAIEHHIVGNSAWRVVL